MFPLERSTSESSIARIGPPSPTGTLGRTMSLKGLESEDSSRFDSPRVQLSPRLVKMERSGSYDGEDDRSLAKMAAPDSSGDESDPNATPSRPRRRRNTVVAV